jgi:hypothetical protein
MKFTKPPKKNYKVHHHTNNHPRNSTTQLQYSFYNSISYSYICTSISISKDNKIHKKKKKKKNQNIFTNLPRPGI